MENYNNGHVVDARKIPLEDYEAAAKEWSEGNKALEDLLLYCLKNKIITQACCPGHEDRKEAYLQFELSNDNIKSINKIINRYYNLNGVNMTFFNEPGVISKFEIRVPEHVGERFFKDMLSQLSNGLTVETESLPVEMKSTLEAMAKHRVPHDYVEVQYAVANNQRKMFFGTSNAAYSESFVNSDRAKPWVDNGVGIEGSPEEITPIVNNVSKLAPYQYSNYVESQKRVGNPLPEQELKDQLQAGPSAPSVEQPTQVPQQPVQVQPEPKPVVQDRPISIVANAQATRENDFARTNGYTIVEVLPGMSIEQVAKEMCGKRYIGFVNNFKIDGMKYSSPNQIVEAYLTDWEKGKEAFSRAKAKQEQLDNAIIEQQIINHQNLNPEEQLVEGGMSL